MIIIGQQGSGTPTDSCASSGWGDVAVKHWDELQPRTAEGLLPWEAGGHYRTPRRLQLRDGPGLTSAVQGAIPAGSLVAVWEAYAVEQDALCGRLLCAFVAVQDGRFSGRQGWIRCAWRDHLIYCNLLYYTIIQYDML